jgi:superfamily II DNA or RNA helicase
MCSSPFGRYLGAISAGAVGINLTQANRVFIMEPFLNPALEAQAIGRVHRLGQKRAVEIVRLIVSDSIETRLQSVLSKQFGANQASPVASASNKRTGGHDGPGDVDENDDDNEKPAAADEATSQEVGTLIGCIQADKSVVAAEEFDCLYGLVEDEEPKEETNDGRDGMAGL